ncbi:MAG TPA: FAD-binding protein [Capillimicrobium sp.]|nr:FAD-binding protein [Capillimicrobium sp.]
MDPITLAPSTRAGLPALVTPQDEGYDQARAAWMLTADQRPAAVATVTTVAEAQAVVAYAAEQRCTIAPQATGHLATALPSLARSILVKTKLEGGVEVDAAARRARVPAGALSEELVNAAAAHGLTCLHGSSVDVGVVGYLLGGGLSFYGRRHGVAANHVTAIEVVTADGEHRRVDAERDPDLFWALRGGGGGFGLVTAVEVELFEVATVYAGSLFWPVSAAPAVVRAWNAWQATAPDAITTSLRILCLPPFPEVPEPLRATPVVCIDGILLGDVADGAELLAPLRGAAEPMIDTWAEMPAAAAQRVHGDPEQPVPAIGGAHAIVGALDDAGIDAFLSVTGEGSGSPLLFAELRQLGGALAEAPAGAGVTGSLPGAFAMHAVGIPMTPEVGEAIVARMGMLEEAMQPYDTGRRFLSFADGGGVDAASCYAPEAYARLVQARRVWDPERRFVSTHDIS